MQFAAATATTGTKRPINGFICCKIHRKIEILLENFISYMYADFCMRTSGRILRVLPLLDDSIPRLWLMHLPWPLRMMSTVD